MTTLQSIESHHRSVAEAALSSNMPLNQLAETLRDCAGQLEAVARERRAQEREQTAVADALRRQKQELSRYEDDSFIRYALQGIEIDWQAVEFGSGDDLCT